MQIPDQYLLPDHQRRFQCLISWPPTTVEAAWLNERVVELASRLSGLTYQSIAAKSGLDMLTELSAENRHASIQEQIRSMTSSDEIHPNQSIFRLDVVQDGQEMTFYAPHHLLGHLPAGKAYRYGDHLPAERVGVYGEGVTDEEQDLIRVISESIARLREVISEPVSIPWAANLDIEVRPNLDDDRLVIGRKDWGHTVVNYTDEGVIVDVVAQGDTGSAHTACLYAEDLMLPQDADADGKP